MDGFTPTEKWMELALPLIKDDHLEYELVEWVPRMGDSFEKLFSYGNMLPHEKAAIVSFASYWGWVRLQRSSVGLNIHLWLANGDPNRKNEACYHWLEWSNDHGKKSEELLLRRKKEIALFMSGSYEDVV
jgi:hypothetical protein